MNCSTARLSLAFLGAPRFTTPFCTPKTLPTSGPVACATQPSVTTPAVRTMSTTNAQHRILEKRETTIEEGLAVFDALEPVDVPFMLGKWTFFEISSGHPVDGILKQTGFYGKEMLDAETVHPLLHRDSNNNVYPLVPINWVFQFALKTPWMKSELMRPFNLALAPLLKTETSQARLRMIEHRGKVSAAMVYDYMAVIDYFRKIDDDRVLGVMDLKNIEAPYLFCLERDNA